MTFHDNISNVTGSPVYLLFDVKETKRLAFEDISGLAAGTLGAIRIRSFFPANLCRRLLEGLETHQMGSYDEKLVSPRIAKLGPTAYDYYADGALPDHYWSAANEASRQRGTLLDGTDPLSAMISIISDHSTIRLRPASAQGRELFAGIVREINRGARLHFDEVGREMPGSLDGRPAVQLAFNCFIAVPEAGGECVVFRRRWSPEDETHRDGYGYHPSVVAGAPHATVAAEVGDAVIFDPRNYHLVQPNVGQGRRLTLSFFIGASLGPEMMVWS